LFGREKIVQGAQDLRELLGGQLGRSARAGTEAGQLDDLFASQSEILCAEMSDAELAPLYLFLRGEVKEGYGVCFNCEADNITS
jgi:hypothetical protein